MKYFGTDGVRGVANDTLTIEISYKIGQYLGYHFSKDKQANIVIGKDPRLSSDFLLHALASGASSTGANVDIIGYCTTPCVSYSIIDNKYDCGVMISASHNPYYDNGIKVFNNLGYKLQEEIEDKIEQYIDNLIDIKLANSNNIGTITYKNSLLNDYINHLVKLFDINLSNIKVLVDGANGSASYVIKDVFKILNINATYINCSPDLLNINVDCGSTHINNIINNIKKDDYDLGFAFDGDADRLIIVDQDGHVVDGDHILYICSKYYKEINQLNKNTIVTTIMSNIGLFKALEQVNINTSITKVGDKYVFNEMTNNNYILGGEQSGHIIFSKLAPSGDGILTALFILHILSNKQVPLKELYYDLKIYPQLLVNHLVKDKDAVLNNDTINKLINTINDSLKDNGRILVRPSGTEPLIRVMVEASDQQLCHKYVYSVIDLIKQLDL